jgi:peroxiredoxin
MKKIWLAAVAAALVAGSAWGAKSVPAFNLKNLDGKTTTFKDLAEKYRLMAFVFWGSTCDPCKSELAEINKFAGNYEGFGVVAVAVDTARTSAQVKPYIKGQGYTFEVLLDVDGDLQRGLGVVGTPYSFLVTAAGDVIYEHSGFRKGDEKKMEEEILEYFAGENAGEPSSE